MLRRMNIRTVMRTPTDFGQRDRTVVTSSAHATVLHRIYSEHAVRTMIKVGGAVAGGNLSGEGEERRGRKELVSDREADVSEGVSEDAAKDRASQTKR